MLYIQVQNFDSGYRDYTYTVDTSRKPPLAVLQTDKLFCTTTLCLKKTSHLWLPITLTYVNRFWYFFAEMLPVK